MRTITTLFLLLFLTALTAQISPFNEGKILGMEGSTKDQIAFVTYPFGSDQLLLSQEAGRRVSFYRFDGTNATEILRGTYFTSVKVIADLGEAILLETIENDHTSRLSILYFTNNVLETVIQNIVDTKAYEVAQGQRYFLISTDFSSGEELFLSIDTETLQVSDLAEALPEGGQASRIRQGGGLLLFKMQEKTYASDGLLENTVSILDATQSFGPIELVYTPFGIVFSDDRNLYLTDGTPEGTRLINDPASLTNTPRGLIRNLTPNSDGLIFTGLDSSNVDHVYFTDGTASGTRPIRAFENSSIFTASRLIEDSILLFRVYDELSEQYAVWQSDGSFAGTRLVWQEKDTEQPLSPNLRLSEINSITDDNQISLITSNVDNTNYELYLNVVTQDERKIVIVVDSLASGSRGMQKTLIDSWLFLQNNEELPNQTQIRFNGGSPVFQHGPDLQPILENFTTVVLPDGNILPPVFSASTGREPGVFMPATGQINTLSDIHPGTANSEVSFFELNDQAYFVARNAENEYIIYSTDGSLPGTTPLTLLHNRPPSLPLRGFVNLEGPPLVKYGETWGMIDSVSNQFLPIPGISNFNPGNFPSSRQIASIGNTIGLAGIRSFVVVNLNDRTTRQIIPFDETLAVSDAGTFKGEYVVMTERNRNVWLVFYNPLTDEIREELVISNSPDPIYISSNTLFSVGDKLFVRVSFAPWDANLHEYIPGQGLVNRGFPGLRVSPVPNSSDNLAAITSYDDVNGFSAEYIITPDQDLPQTFSLLEQFGRFDVPTGIELYDDRLIICSKGTIINVNKNDLDDVKVLATEANPSFSKSDHFSSPTPLVDGTFLFTYQKESQIASTIWQTDGTPGGTYQLADLSWYDPYLAYYYNRSLRIPTIENYAAFSPASRGLYFFDFVNRVGYPVRPQANFGQVSEAYGKFFAVDNTSNTSVLRYYYPTPVENDEFGTIFWDANANGLYDTTEAPVATQAVTIEVVGENGSVQYFSNEQGQYLRPFLANAEYQLSITPNACWESTTPNSYLLTDAAETPNFGLRPRPESEATTALISSPITRCGFTIPFWVQVKNTGCVPLSNLQASLTLDADVVVNDITIEPTSMEENVLQWSIPELAVGKSWRAQLSLTMPNEERAGEVVEYLLNVTRNGDTTLNTTFIYDPVLRCAIDPNDKLVHPARPEVSNSNYTQIDETLTYTIRFQNTGNDTAFNVRLEDQLDPALDHKTFQPLNASHPHRVELSNEGLLRVFFDDILLPDSNVDYVSSNGFFAFTIQLDTSALNQSINNSAGIYFDFNDPVITNTVSNTIVKFIDEDQDGYFFWEDCNDKEVTINPAATEIPGNGIDENCDELDTPNSVNDPLRGTLNVFPNPTEDRIIIHYSLPGQLLVALFDGQGRELHEWSINQEGSFDLSNLPSAVYLLRILDPENGNFSTRRVIKK